jgi:hypothetical protein
MMRIMLHQLPSRCVWTVLVCMLLMARKATSETPPRRPQSAATAQARSAAPHRGDAADVRDDLRARITRFQDEWRKLWEKARTTADGYLQPELFDREDIKGTRTRRTAALQCYLTTPFVQNALLPFRPVVTSPDRGAICPLWSPPGGNEPSNEGEVIDFSLRLSDRRKARQLRDRLIGELEAAQAKHPTDDWIAGQRVRFTYDQGTPAQTLAAARSCRGSAGWCAMLQGLAHAQADELIDAESAFRQGDALGAPLLDSLPSGCAAAQVQVLIPRAERERFVKAACAPSSPTLDYFWWLADPLWSVPGNDRYVAHQARRTLIVLRSAIERDERYVWDVNAAGLSMRETILRYGWPNYTFWPAGQYEGVLANQLDFGVLGPTAAATQVQQASLPVVSPRRRTASIALKAPETKVVGPRFVRLPFTVKEYTTDQTALVPALSAILDPFRLTASDWTLSNPNPDDPDRWWPQEFLQLKRPLMPLGDGQLGLWRRDTTVRMAHIVALPLAARKTLDSTTDLALLAGGPSPVSTQIYAQATLTLSDAVRYQGAVPSGPLVLSAELISQAPRAPNYRNRFAMTAPPTLREMSSSELALSDPVLVRLGTRDSEPPKVLAEVIAQMASSEEFRTTERLALYWEGYGFPVREPLEVSLRVRSSDGVNVVRRLGSLLGVNGQPDSVSIRYTEQEPTRLADSEATTRPVTVHGVGLDLAQLEPGTYVVSIELRTRANQSARSERRFVIR